MTDDSDDSTDWTLGSEADSDEVDDEREVEPQV